MLSLPGTNLSSPKVGKMSFPVSKFVFPFRWDMLNKTLIYGDAMLLPNRCNVSTKAERTEPSFPCVFGFLRFLCFSCFFRFVVLSQFCQLFSFYFWDFLVLVSLLELLYVFSLLHLFLDFPLSSSTSLFCFSSFFSLFFPISIISILSFLIFSHSLCFILGFWWCRGNGAKEGKPRGCCSQVLPRAGGYSYKPGFVRLG